MESGLVGGRRPITMGFIARATLVVVGISAIISLFWLGRDILFVAFFGILFALFLSLFVNPLERWGIPRLWGTILALVLLVGLGVLVAWLVWPTLHSQIILIRHQLPVALHDALTWIEAQRAALGGGSAEVTSTDPDQDLHRRIEEILGRIIAGALPLLQTASGVVVGSVLVLITGIYLSIDPHLYVRGLVSLVPPEGRERFRATLYSVGHDLRLWILGTLINMLIIGAMTTVGLLFLGVPAALVLGLIAFFLEFISFYGPILSAVPAVAVALLTSGESAFWVIVLYIGIHQSEGNIVQPLVMRGTVHLPPVLTVLVGAFMAILFGFLGLILAVPLMAMVIVFVERLYIQPLNAHALRIARAPPGRERGDGE